MKCKDCKYIQVIDINWPYCGILQDTIFVNDDGTCDHCPNISE